jgi:hypothetical protein
MKKQLSITLLTIVSLAAVLLNLSCGGTQQNNIAGSNAVNSNVTPGNTAQSNRTNVTADCSGDTPAKQKKIKDGIRDNIKNQKKLDYQYVAKKFDFEPVVGTNGDATLYIWGSVLTAANDVDDLNKTYKDFMKRGCVVKVLFTSPPERLTTEARFNFTLCEAPNQICPDGTCQEVCNRKDGNDNTNMNSNSNK